MSSIALFRRLLGYSLRYWIAFLVSVLGMMIAAAAETAFPALMKTLMDDGFSRNDSFDLWLVPVAILLVFFFRGIASFLANYAMYWLSQNVLRDIRSDMYQKLLSLPSAAFDARSAGSWISKLINDAQQVLMAATNVITVLIRDSLVIIGLIAWLLWLNWQLTIVVLLLIPPLAFMTRKFSERMRGVSRTYLSTISEMTSNVEEAIAGNRVIKIFGGQDYETKKFAEINAAHRAQGMRISIASALQAPVTQFIASIGVAAVLTIALMQTRAGEATIGDFVSFITAMIMMLNPLRHLADINSQIQRGLAAAEGVFAMIDEPSELNQGKEILQDEIGMISFKNVSVQYVTRDMPAVKNINIEIPQGATFAFVGPSGSGKTTLINLIPRLYDPTSGVIQIGGRDLRTLSLESLRSKISYVSQEIVLFNDTIAKNITYGRRDVSGEEIIRALQAADLKEFVESLPMQLNTVVGGRGVQLSGGQRQRVAIARAVIKNAPILILDEATSALDSASELSIQNAIENLRKNKTTLIVAHRLSTVLGADEIVVMNQGDIVQRGKHYDLLNESGLYRALYSDWTKKN